MPIKIVSSTCIKESGVAFGTSGARGLVTQFTTNVCAAFSVAFVASIREKFTFNQVAIAIDNRPSSNAMAQACAAALAQLNIDVIYYGVVPTPALAYIAQEHKIPAIMVTGSHIPFDRNGLKFYRPDGEISKSDEQAILNESVEFENILELPNLVINDEAAEMYITRYTSLFNSPWLSGKRIGIYEHSSAGRDIYYKIFEALGAEVIALERSDSFVPIDTEAVSEEDTAKAIAWSQKFNLDLVFSTDGDGDRPLVSDEKGYWLRGDILGLLTSNALNIEALAVPVSCNTAIESCHYFSHIARTKIGSPYVIAEFENLKEKYRNIAGFEANGGYLLGSDIEVNGQLLKALPTRDAVLPVVMLLLASTKVTISTLVNKLPPRFTASDRIQNFPTVRSQAIIHDAKRAPEKLLKALGFDNADIKAIDNSDGFRVSTGDGTIVHLRPSGNAPELRCYVESDTYLNAVTCVERCLRKIQNI